MDINIDKELREIENFLRDNICFILKNKYEDKWEQHLEVTEERINAWKERMEDEKRRLNGKKLDDRLLYYSDFYDLKTIVSKNWNDIFLNVFHDKKRLEYMLDMLETFRNPNAHNRDLLEHQKHLLVGIAGELKMDIMSYRGDKEKEESFFPKIDSIQVNTESYNFDIFKINKLYRVGDTLEIVIYTSCPPNCKLEYKYGHSGEWQSNSKFIIKLTEDNIGHNSVLIYIKSDARYNKYKNYDDSRTMLFTVAPNE